MSDETDLKDGPAADAGADFEAQQAAAEAGADPSISLEDLAREMGWSPKDAWRGDPDAWRPAADFLRSTVTVNKSLRAEIKDIKRSIEKTTTQMAEEKFGKLKAQLEAKFEEAVETGDKQAAKQASAELAKLEQQQGAGGDSPEDAFAAENPWYGKDDEATAYAIGISQRLAAQGKSVAEQLAAAKAGVEKRFPELFEVTPKRKQPAAVHEPGSRGAGQRSGGQGWNDLPTDVQQEMERAFVRTGMVKDKALLAKNWFAENKGN